MNVGSGLEVTAGAAPRCRMVMRPTPLPPPPPFWCAFLGMMAENDAKRQLEREVLNAERMASIGPMAAGIAHEVNNPLGGMLAAIDNRRLRGDIDEASGRTLALLERGLQQIHLTVSALLHEARLELHELRDDDP